MATTPAHHRMPDQMPATMKAMLTIGNGGYEQLQYRDVPLPQLRAGEVLLQVLAAGINNTDINTRVGWYGSADKGLGWNGATPFPLIQGADCCGRVVAVADDVLANGFGVSIGARVLVRSCMRVAGFDSPHTRWLGTDMPGAFAQFVTVPASEVFAVNCDWTDAQLATIPCAYGTAENMLQRVNLAHGERVLVTGASGGVGSAVVQLAKRRRAIVTAVTTRAKQAQLLALGADEVLFREDDLLAVCSEERMDVVVDNVAGGAFGQLLKVLKRGGRYVSSGAIAGAQVGLDMRDLYLKDISLYGCTAWSAPVFPDLIGYIERGEIKPLLAATYPLQDMASAQQSFLQKQHTGNLVLLTD
jgi:NADPH:quinone reductase-like Zn-dependent oxidoreductase